MTAPFGGRVADLLVVEGEYVPAGAQLMTIVDLNPIKVEVQVLEAELGSLSEGRRAEVSFPAFPGELFEGAIETIKSWPIGRRKPRNRPVQRDLDVGGIPARKRQRRPHGC